MSKALKKGKQVELDDASFSALLLLESQKWVVGRLADFRQPEPELTSLAVKSLDAAVGRIVEGAVDAAAAPLLEAWAGLLPVAQRAGVLDRELPFDTLTAECITNRTAKLVAKSSDIGVACMRVAVAEAAVTGNHSLVLAAYVAIASHGVSEQLDAVFVPDAASYAAQLEDIAAALSACAFRPRLLALLQAAKVLVRARVEGSGQAVAEFVAKVLITLQSLHGSDVTLSMLELVETIVTERVGRRKTALTADCADPALRCDPGVGSPAQDLAALACAQGGCNSTADSASRSQRCLHPRSTPTRSRARYAAARDRFPFRHVCRLASTQGESRRQSSSSRGSTLASVDLEKSLYRRG